MRAIGYVRVSTSEQADSGAGLAAQRQAITAATRSRDWTLVDVLEDAGASGKSMRGRTALEAALAVVEGGQADVLVVAKLDRLSRSVVDFAALMERARARGWTLVALDLGVDTTTPAGEMVANIMAALAQWERRVIGQRTREAMAARKAEGVHVGRRSAVPPAVVERICRERAAGASLAAVADVLNREGVPTPAGGRQWYSASVRDVLLREKAA